GLWAQVLDFFDNWDDVAEAMLGVTIIIIAGILWTFWGRRRLPYGWWYALHPLVYVGLYFSIEHQFETGPTATATSIFVGYWWFLYGFLALNIAYYRLVRPVLLFWRYRFEILEIKPECEDVVSVLIGGKNIKAFKFAAGQFVSVRFLAKGFWWEEHPFSLSKAPGGDTLRLSIKALGDFTRKVPQLISGTKILLDGPFGTLTAARSKKDKVALYAGGIGITPLRALAEEFLQLGKKVTLFYGNRTQQGIALKAELDFLAAENRLQLYYVLSADPKWQGERGNIDREKVSRLLPDFSDCDHYLCGPPPMMSKLEQSLKEMGVTTKYIHNERFAF
ncbi:MAG: hypothetical protein GYA55_02075, partial [SAR324 cluster bacterium]|nr:hypothetical protein [SAR324 cluster bacterium]